MNIYQFEITNYCNARCSYCPHPMMTREKGNASPRVIEAVAKHLARNGQNYIGLHHMGEPLMHPKIASIVRLFAQRGIATDFSTNGLLLYKKGLEVLQARVRRLRIAVDYFWDWPGYPDKIKEFLHTASRFNSTEIRVHTITGNNLDELKSGQYGNNILFEEKAYDNWAGTFDKASELKEGECYFVDRNYGVVTWDGKIIQCCIDYDGEHVLGSILEDTAAIWNKRTSLCSKCKGLQFAEGWGDK